MRTLLTTAVHNRGVGPQMMFNMLLISFWYLVQICKNTCKSYRGKRQARTGQLLERTLKPRYAKKEMTLQAAAFLISDPGNGYCGEAEATAENVLARMEVSFLERGSVDCLAVYCLLDQEISMYGLKTAGQNWQLCIYLWRNIPRLRFFTRDFFCTCPFPYAV